jgi:hypothetical protein
MKRIGFPCQNGSTCAKNCSQIFVTTTRSLERKRANRRSILVIFAGVIPCKLRLSATRWSTALPDTTIPITNKANAFF